MNASLLAATDLCRRIDDRVLFEGLSLSLDAGEAVAIRGPSGSGKTSLLRMLAWLDRPDAGELRLHEKPAAEWGGPAWRARVAFVQQSPARLPGTPRETVSWLGELKHGAVAEDPVALAETWALPAERWDKAWSQLSGGEAQRVALALALCRDPEVLLLDEPTSALDADAAEAVVDALRGRAVIFVTHDDALVDSLSAREVGL